MIEAPGSVVRRARGVFYGWWLVGLIGFLLAIMAASVYQGLGTFFVVLERQFGWSRTSLSGAFSLARMEGAILGPIEGWLVDQIGNRLMVQIGYTIMGVGFILFSQVNALWQFYAVFLIIMLGAGLGGWLALVSLVNNWFVRRRSFAMGAATSGVHLGGGLVPVLAYGIESHGFRITTFGIGVFLLAVVPTVSKLIRNRPEEYGLRTDGDPIHSVSSQAEEAGGARDDDDEPSYTARQAMATPAFWMITFVHLSSTVSIVSLMVHLVPKLTDMDQSLGAASLVVLTYTAIAFPTQFIAGYMADRLPKSHVMFLFLGLQAGGILVIGLAENLYMAYLFAVLYGIGFGGRMPVLTAIRGDYFGRKAYATIMGLSMFPNNIVMIGAPLFAGYMFDTTGTYIIPFLSFAALNFLGATLALFVRKPKQPAGRIRPDGS